MHLDFIKASVHTGAFFSGNRFSQRKENYKGCITLKWDLIIPGMADIPGPRPVNSVVKN